MELAAAVRVIPCPDLGVPPTSWTKVPYPDDWQTRTGFESGTVFYGPALRESAGAGGLDPVRDEIARCAHLPPVAQVLAIDIGTSLADRMLTKVDRAAMFTSLEVRVPLVGYTLLSRAASSAAALPAGGGKRAMASAPRVALPTDLVQRVKTGFGLPLAEWLSDPRLGVDAYKRVPSLARPTKAYARRFAYSLFELRRSG